MSIQETSAKKRRSFIKTTLQNADAPITASFFASKFSVSRQIIVGDVAILRASGLEILATPRGYIIGTESDETFPYVGMIACKHSAGQLRDELYTIVDYGATVIDVTIEHAIYGELSGKLNLSSRYEVDLFMEKVKSEKNSAPISSLTDGVHLHRIGYKDKATFELIKAALAEQNILIE